MFVKTAYHSATELVVTVMPQLNRHSMVPAIALWWCLVSMRHIVILLAVSTQFSYQHLTYIKQPGFNLTLRRMS